MIRISSRDRGGPTSRQRAARGPEGTSGQSNSMPSSLVDAMGRGFFQQVRYLVELGTDVNERDETGKTALILCAFIEEGAWGVGLARTLLEKGASGSCRDHKGLNALHYACVYERVELVRTLLKAIDFDLNQGDLLGNTPLHYAADSGNAYITKIMVDALLHYRMSVDKPNKAGITALIQAWKSGQVICANIIQNIGKADTEWRDYVESKSAKEWQEDAMNNMPQILSRRHRRQNMAAHPRRSSAKARRMFGQGNVRPKSAGPEKVRVKITVLENDLLAIKDYETLIRNINYPEIKSNFENLIRTTHTLHRQQSAPGYTAYRDYEDMKNQVPLHTDRSASTCDGSASSWKTEIGALFHALQFQCTTSFRPSVRILSPRDESDLDRPASPTLSDDASEDHQSISSRKSSRRNSGLSSRGESKRRAPILGQAMQFVSSVNNTKSKKSSNDSSLRFSADGTNSDANAGNVKNTAKKKQSKEARRTSVQSVPKEDVSDSSSQHTDKSNSSSASTGSASGAGKDVIAAPKNQVNASSKDAGQRSDPDPSTDNNHGFVHPLAAIDESQE